MLRGLAILQLDFSGVQIHPDCIDARPFSMEIFIFVGALLILAAILVTISVKSGGSTRHRDRRASTRRLNANALSSLVLSELANNSTKSRRRLLGFPSDRNLGAREVHSSGANPMLDNRAAGRESSSSEEEVLPVKSVKDLRQELTLSGTASRRQSAIQTSNRPATLAATGGSFTSAR